MSKKKLSILFVVLLFIINAFVFLPVKQEIEVLVIDSPVKMRMENQEFTINDLDCFDSFFSDKNKKLSQSLHVTEEEAFIFGNLSKYWAENLLQNRKVIITKNDLLLHKISYRTQFLYSGFCIQGDKPYFQYAFDNKIKMIRKGYYKVLDIDTDKIYNVEDFRKNNIKNFVVIRNSQIPKELKKKYKKPQTNKDILIPQNTITAGYIKLILSDLTTKTVPDRKCETTMCKELLSNINNANKTIDIAIYGYSTVPALERAIKNAQNRGVKIRLIYDVDAKGNNIYENTKDLIKLIPLNVNDSKSIDAKNIMHNKFYIFDDKILITGSANLSHTDMSGFNSNSMVIINSPEIALIYKKEFEQMYNGKFHSEKIKNEKKLFDNKIQVYFSPQDKTITNAILPLINNSKKYIYIPTFLLTEKRIAQSLINAKNRGVEVKIIVDALNASVKHTKHNDLRFAGIDVKTENYAGKMHSKSMIIDDEYVVIGSMNFSNSGENKNDENIIILHDSKLAKFYKKFFLYQWNKIDNKWLKYNVKAESKYSIGSCSDGIDNDYDGFVDKDDPACK